MHQYVYCQSKIFILNNFILYSFFKIFIQTFLAVGIYCSMEPQANNTQGTMSYQIEQLVIYYLQWVEEAKKQLKIFEDQIRQLQLFVNSYQNGISELNSLKEAVQKEINVNVSSQKTNFLKYSKGIKKIEQLEKEVIQLQKESMKSFQF
eukprot:TRINITY_DN1732_c1_g1_i2.p2 TRINITY_DN1732_c1_g1~~TRINITY_DN1732_c1_g1_i2.p2  ORF type:complete len:149 (-),score=0.43 TRINITY_DN1732_c1_g1_i2:423-869(-)